MQYVLLWFSMLSPNANIAQLLTLLFDLLDLQVVYRRVRNPSSPLSIPVGKHMYLLEPLPLLVHPEFPNITHKPI
jgi:hypothetical protein